MNDLDFLNLDRQAFPPDGSLPDIASPLLAWYDRGRRVLPWREEPTPYRVWVSEIMLQQTRVQAVLPYFERFLAALPTLRDLAEAPEEQLAKLWEGLGYYSRVRNMKKAAQLAVERYGGELPPSYEALLSLPGIGEYTAGAVSSIAFGIPVPAVDGNVLRVFSRVFGCWADVLDPKTKRGFQAVTSRLLPEDRPGDFNQSLMELGATVCLPNGAPHCLECPLRELCCAYREGTAADLPVKAPKKARRVEERTVVLLIWDGRVLVRRRPDKGLLAGLWEFPNVEGWRTREEAAALLREYQPEKLIPLREAKHIFSHVEWRMAGFLAECAFPGEPKEGERWVTREELEGECAVPSAFRAYRDLGGRL